MNPLALLCLADTVSRGSIGDGQVDSFAPGNPSVGLAAAVAGGVRQGRGGGVPFGVVDAVVGAGAALVAAHIGRRQGRLANSSL